MTDRDPITPDQLDAYLDERLSPAEKQAFEQRLADAPDVQERITEQREIDEALRHHFLPPAVTTSEVEQWVVAAESDVRQQVVWKRRSVAWIAVALAVAAAWLVVFSRWGGNVEMEPFFEPRPLAELYLEAVRDGFRPYYLCDDETRFRKTFEKRQGVPLRLAEMPESRTMAGLSYLGGLSRETTAMLCHVQQQPVVVFVDRREFQDQALLTVPVGSGLHIHRATLGDLVTYEVTPFAEPKILEFLEVVGAE